MCDNTKIQYYVLMPSKGVPIPPTSGKDISCPVNTSISTKDLPESFDARTQWPQLIHPVRDQVIFIVALVACLVHFCDDYKGGCGSCWAFAASEVLSDRLAIATQGKENVVLSPMALVNCDTEVSCVAPARRPTYVSC